MNRVTTIEGRYIRLEQLSAHRFRNEWILPDGRVRSCFVYSIIDSEWSQRKALLRDRLQRPASSMSIAP